MLVSYRFVDLKLHDFIKVALLIVTILFILCNQAIAEVNNSNDCSSCHSAYPSDRFDQYLESNAVDYNNCVCHQRISQNHGFVATYSSPFGFFKSTDSFGISAGSLHTKHLDEHQVGQNCNTSCHNHHEGVSGQCYNCHVFIQKDGLYGPQDCKDCHYSADCQTCHQVPVPHSSHGNVAPRASLISTGYSINQMRMPESAYSTNVSCINEQCHQATFNQQGAEGLVLRPNCNNCHSDSTHNFLSPSDIPLYSENGYLWSVPIAASQYNGEPWLESIYQDSGHVIFTNHQITDGEAIYNWYLEQLALNGWTQISVNKIRPDYWSMVYQKISDSRQLIINFYSTEFHDPYSLPVLTGPRIEILYL
ncbi:MAG: hypothetical protein C4562_07510 [Actinobacteria bacterium]|nr:MAG: hypothetical protein C4562_07510 [Actinomycetota bacterium]